MYQAQLSRTTPGCFVFLLDQSGSMGEAFGTAGETKAQFLANAMNKLLKTLVLRCAKGPEIRDYFDVAVIGYGETVGSALEGRLRGRSIVPISEIGLNQHRMESRTRQISDGAGGLVQETIEFPVWIDPQASNGTPMAEALTTTTQLLEGWIKQHPQSFPPIVMNLTDGEATDADPLPEAQRLTRLSTSDGPVLLFNLHLSTSPLPAIAFPHSERGLADDYARLLYHMSSVLPEPFIGGAMDEGYAVHSQSRGYTFNADGVALIKFLQIGTSTTKAANLLQLR